MSVLCRQLNYAHVIVVCIGRLDPLALQQRGKVHGLVKAKRFLKERMLVRHGLDLHGTAAMLYPLMCPRKRAYSAIKTPENYLRPTRMSPVAYL